jgi:hypothetical protein
MSKNQFEQLIEYVINDEDAKAKELFHQIVVSKSRQIYENLMQEGENEMGLTPSEVDTNMDESDDMMGGSQTGEMIDELEAEENGGSMHEGEDEDEADIKFDDEAEDDGEDFTKDMEHDHDMGDDEPASKSDVMNLANKLDELMADFEDMMGGGDMGDDAGMGDDGMDDEEVDFDEFETEGMMENITLKAAPKPVTSEPAGTNTKSITAFNSGQAGMEGRPVKMTGDTAKGRPAPTAKEMPDYQGDGHYGKPGPAPKPHLGQAAGVNTRTPFPKGK